MKTVIKLALAGLLFGGQFANAALVSFSLTGLVDATLDPLGAASTVPNAYGLSIGDSLLAEGVYDDSGLSFTGNETVLMNIGTNALSITAGNASFTQLNDTAPQLMLTDGVVTGLNFLAAFDTNGTFTSNGNYFWGDDNGGYQIEGYWSASVAPVPVPAAVWLFGSGLVGLAAIARRRVIA